MNSVTRMGVIRQRLQDAQSKGMLGVTAARAGLPEGMLREWLEKPALAPARHELTHLEKALGLHSPQEDQLPHDGSVNAILDDC